MVFELVLPNCARDSVTLKKIEEYKISCITDNLEHWNIRFYTWKKQDWDFLKKLIIISRKQHSLIGYSTSGLTKSFAITDPLSFYYLQ